MDTYKTLTGFLLTILFIFCLFGKGRAAKENTTDPTGLELALPTVPETLVTPADRAGYVMMHFWDALDASDTTKTLNADFVEQNFANFISLFPVVDSTVQRRAVENLMHRMIPQREAYRLLVETARKYLYEPESPALNEDYYRLVLDAAQDGPDLGIAERSRENKEREWMTKNRVGTYATDFVYRTDNGELASLLSTEIQDDLLLVLYDPDCEHCQDVMDTLSDNEELNARIAEGNLEVLAINLYGDTSTGVVDVPENWHHGVDLSGIEEHGLYIVRAAPALYVLDASHKVLLKDCQPEAVVDLLASVRQE